MVPIKPQNNPDLTFPKTIANNGGKTNQIAADEAKPPVLYEIQNKHKNKEPTNISRDIINDPIVVIIQIEHTKKILNAKSRYDTCGSLKV